MSYEGTLDPWVFGSRRVFCCHKALLSGGFVPNSLEAVAECVAAGVPRIEIDVQFLSDDAMLVYHDATLERESTGTGPVFSLDRAAARQLRYRSDGRDARVAFFEEVIDLLRDSNTVLQIDLKLDRPFSASRLEAFLQAIAPLGERAVIGSQAYWNVRRLAGHGHPLALDPTWQWNMFGSLHDGVGPSHQGVYGLWDDSPLAHVLNVSPADYVRGRIADIAGLLPEASEWMVDIETILQLSSLGEPLGALLRERGISLTAWTMRDRGEEVSGPLLARLFELGVSTIITDYATVLSGYAQRLTEAKVA